jgi:fructose-1,6-bisphosphatase-3
MSEERNIATLHDIIRQIAEIETELDSHIDTTMWISDPHGAGDRFVSILKGRFGLVWKICLEALPKTFAAEKIDYLGRIIRREKYFTTPEFSMERQDVISALVRIIQYRVENAKKFSEIRKNINKDLKTVLENLILKFPVPNVVYENEIISDRIISALCKVVKQVILGHLLVLGDVFDRGDEPDKILRILSSKEIRPYVTFVWGNHDILWMGAAAGNRSLIAEALRISVRYDNLKFLDRLGIDINRLKSFAEKLYPAGVAGSFKAKQDISRKMEKTLAMIQFKLEEKTIKANPELGMEHRLNLEKFAAMLKAKNVDGLTDTDFPTLDLDNPLRLTDEEQEVIDNLALQFTSSPRIKSLMKFLFEEGCLYHINNYILNIHALIPSTESGQFDIFMGKKGKELFDFIEQKVKTVGQRYLNDEKQDEKDLALMFYLWCGAKSPFFGKDAMKTFERYFYKDKITHKEKLLYWGENIRKTEFMNQIMKEFGVKRIVYGHTPVDISKGEKIASPDGRAINIDGGFSDAYLERGHSLIQTPASLYAIILPTPEEIRIAREKRETPPMMVEVIDSFDPPLKIKDTHKGVVLRAKLDELYTQLETFNRDGSPN